VQSIKNLTDLLSDDKVKKMLLTFFLPFALLFSGVFYLLSRDEVAFIKDRLPIPAWLTATLLALLSMFLVSSNKSKNKDFSRRNEEHGSARWGGEKDIKPFIDKNPLNNIILTQTESLTMNSRPKKPEYARNLNVVIVGGSGSGKTRGYVKPNLMQCESLDYPVSFVITDPKGQVLSECGQMLQKHRYKIKTLNTVDFAKSMKYNPFAYIKSEKDILTLVTALMENTTDPERKGGEDFWAKAEQLLYCALIGYIHFEALPEQRNMNTLVYLINNMETREEDEEFKNAVDLIFEELENGNTDEGVVAQPDHFAVRQYKKYKLAAGKTAKSILISCGARLAPFDIAEVRELMSGDEMELDKLGGYKKYNPETKKYEIIKRKTALFVIVSDTKKTFNFIVGLMYSQMFNLLCEKADNDFRGRLPVHVRCILDEFANIGKIPDFEILIATIRSREISANIILQAYAQLKTIYKEAAPIILSNCDTKLFLGGGDKETLKEWSEILGKQTIDMANDSENFGRNSSGSRSYQKVGRELMTTDEMAVLPRSKCLLQISGARPWKSQKYDITKHKNYMLLSDFDDKNTFDVKQYIEKSKEYKEKKLAQSEKKIKDNMQAKKQSELTKLIINPAEKFILAG
jgi:type IV secretion system protein VirD4